MDDGVRIAETRAETRAEIDMRHLVAAHRVHQPQLVNEHRHRARRLAHAEAVEGAEGVGGELDPGADLAKLGRLLEHGDRKAAPGKAERRGKPADAAPRNENRKIGAAHRPASSITR